jgi:hypothetical protein
MDRRIFQPPPTGGQAHRRTALRMASAVLLAGGLALWHLRGGGLGLDKNQGMFLLLALLTAGYLYARARLKRAQRAGRRDQTPIRRPAPRVKFPAAPPDEGA